MEAAINDMFQRTDEEAEREADRVRRVAHEALLIEQARESVRRYGTVSEHDFCVWIDSKSTDNPLPMPKPSK